jgi:hypothetical protein
MASDPDIKAIVCNESVIGTSAAFEKVREIRSDILLVAGAPTDDAQVISKVADICYSIDFVNYGSQIGDLLKQLGAKAFVFYSFPRHQARILMQMQRQELEKACAKNGIKFLFTTCPDPQSDAGITGAQQFMLEDVRRKVAELGKETAFYNTNITVTETLIKAVLDNNAIFPWPSDPSPFNGYAGAMNISISDDKLGDSVYMESQIIAYLKAHNMAGRMGMWDVPWNTMGMKGAIEYAVSYINGEFANKNEMVQLKNAFEKVSGSPVTVRDYEENGVKLPSLNYYYVLGGYHIMK